MRALATLVVVSVVLLLSTDADANGNVIHVRNGAEFAAAVARLRDTGGTVRLRRNEYRSELVVPGARPDRCASSASAECGSRACC